MQRYFEIKNFRNIGIKEPQKLILNTSLDKDLLGNVIYIVGPNNSGKSNVLDALAKFGSNGIEKRDIPDFEDSDPKPELKFVCYESKATYTQSKDLINQTKFSGFHYDDSTVKQEKPLNLSVEALTFSKSIISFLEGQNLRSETFKKFKAAVDEKNEKAIVELFPSINTYLLNTWGNSFYSSYLRGYQLTHTALITEIIETSLDSVGDIFQRKYGFNLIPNIIALQNTELKQAQFLTTPAEIDSNPFLLNLFGLIGYNVDEIKNSYSKFNERKTRGTLSNTENKINEMLTEVSNRFNKLYLLEEKKYRFEIILDSTQIAFQIYLDDLTLDFDRQSTGFKWFFNFYLTLASHRNLSAGDIIIMDEPATNLHVKGIEELRDFIKEYAKKSKLTFVISTHSPFFIDVDYLENVRIVSRVNNEAIINSKFSLLDGNDIDSLGHVKNALTVSRHILLDPTKKTVFVEGITDYCYLTAFKQYFKIKDIVFLPIDGLNDSKDNRKLKNDKDLFEALLKIEKFPTLLVDDDIPGQQAQKRANEKYKGRIEVLKLSDLVPEAKEIEDLFDSSDTTNKTFNDAVNFKSRLYANRVSTKTKENFKKLLETLRD